MTRLTHLGPRRSVVPAGSRESERCIFGCLFGGTDMRRRDFITLVGGTALAWPLEAGAQQQKQVFRIGFLGTDGGAADAIFVNSLRAYGLVEGQNLSIERRATTEPQLIPGMVADTAREFGQPRGPNNNPWGIAAKGVR